jgi:hypothetical protein
MTLATYTTAERIINRVAVEIGLVPIADPYASGADASFTQLTYLLNIAGEELTQAYPWEAMVRSHQILTLNTDTGDYPLPADFLYMINQTGWEHTNRVPLFGALSPQDWTYLKGRKLSDTTIYASFRLKQNLFAIFPQPPPNGLDINFEYQSKNWVMKAQYSTTTFTDEATVSSDVVMYDKTLISRYLKVKYLEVKGLDSTKARDDFAQQFAFVTGKDKSAEVLSAGNGGYIYPYLDGFRNLPDSGYGGA